MTSNFDARKHSKQRSPNELDILQRDGFELLSAYLDGEVTATERKQVQELLAADPDMQRLHSRLLRLRQGIQTLPVPREQSAQQVADHVFSRLERRRTVRWVAWGGTAIAAVFVSALTGLFPGSQSLVPQFAQAPETEAAQEPLMIALNRPVVEIPKAPVASPASGAFADPSATQNSAQTNVN
jgi:anti-sigma factor RsiW